MLKNIKDTLIAYVSIIIGAFAVGYLFSDTKLRFLILFLSSFILIALIYNLTIRIIDIANSRDRFTKFARKLEVEIDQLPFDIAKVKAEQLLNDTAKFAHRKASKPLPAEMSSLGKQFRDLFRKYESIETAKGAAILGWCVFGISTLNPKYTRIGRDNEFSTELVVRDKEDAVYEIDGSEQKDVEIEKNKYDTVFHWILYAGSSLK